MQPQPEPERAPTEAENRAYARRLAARLAGRSERREQVIVRARARLDQSATDAFSDSLARDLVARFRSNSAD